MSDCYCDYEPSTIWNVTEPKARIHHQCCECLGLIKPGERYKKADSLFDGRWSTYKRCADCQHIACELNRMLPCWCDVWGEFHERFGDELANNFKQADELKRIAGMFNAVAEARGGSRIWSSALNDDE